MVNKSAAVGTDPVKDHSVRSQSESVYFGLFFLKLLNLRVDELYMVATFFADNVIVMGDSVTGFIPCQTVPEIDPPGYSGLGKDFDGPVYRGLPYGRICLSDEVV